MHLYGKAVIDTVIGDKNHYTHLYGRTVIYANRIRSMVNLTLEAHVKNPLYIAIYCKRVHTNSLVWGLIRLTPITKHVTKDHIAMHTILFKLKTALFFSFLVV